MNDKKNVPFFDLKKQYQKIQFEIEKAISNVLSTGEYVLGETTDRFERSFAEYCGVKYCIGTNNGTMALVIALLASGVKAGDKVLVPANSFISTANAVRIINAIPVFCDVNKDTWTIDISNIIDAVQKHGSIKAIIPVHLYGIMADMKFIIRWAKENNVIVIEDACQAHGSLYEGEHAGTLGEVGCFSFYPTKNLGAYGEAGGIVTNNREIYKIALSLRNNGFLSPHGMQKYIHPIFGYNARISQIQAAILSVKLKYLRDWLSSKDDIVKIYKENIFVSVQHQSSFTENNKIGRHIFTICINDRPSLMEYLSNNGIQTAIHYPIPIHKQGCYEEYNTEKIENVEYLSDHILSLPLYPEMKTDEVIYVCQAINKFYGHNKINI